MRSSGASARSHSDSGRSVECLRPQLSRFRVRFQTTIPRYVSLCRTARTDEDTQPAGRPC